MFKWRHPGYDIICNRCDVQARNARAPSQAETLALAKRDGWTPQPHPTYGWQGNYHLCNYCTSQQLPPQAKDPNFMNLSTAIMLVNDGVRAVRVEYDPDTPKSNNPHVKFKTLDPTLAIDDYVIVPTHTRHGFTVGKVKEIGFRVDFSSAEQFGWVVGKVDKPAYDLIIEQEKTVVDRIGQAEENRMRAELHKSMGLGDIDFTDLDVVKGTALPAPSTPRGDGNVAQADPGLPVEQPPFPAPAPMAPDTPTA